MSTGRSIVKDGFFIVNPREKHKQSTECVIMPWNDLTTTLKDAHTKNRKYLIYWTPRSKEFPTGPNHPYVKHLPNNVICAWKEQNELREHTIRSIVDAIQRGNPISQGDKRLKTITTAGIVLAVTKFVSKHMDTPIEFYHDDKTDQYLERYEKLNDPYSKYRIILETCKERKLVTKHLLNKGYLRWNTHRTAGHEQKKLKDMVGNSAFLEQVTMDEVVQSSLNWVKRQLSKIDFKDVADVMKEIMLNLAVGASVAFLLLAFLLAPAISGPAFAGAVALGGGLHYGRQRYTRKERFNRFQDYVLEKYSGKYRKLDDTIKKELRSTTIDDTTNNPVELLGIFDPVETWWEKAWIETQTKNLWKQRMSTDLEIEEKLTPGEPSKKDEKSVEYNMNLALQLRIYAKAKEKSFSFIYKALFDKNERVTWFKLYYHIDRLFPRRFDSGLMKPEEALWKNGRVIKNHTPPLKEQLADPKRFRLFYRSKLRNDYTISLQDIVLLHDINTENYNNQDSEADDYFLKRHSPESYTLTRMLHPSNKEVETVDGKWLSTPFSKGSDNEKRYRFYYTEYQRLVEGSLSWMEQHLPDSWKGKLVRDKIQLVDLNQDTLRMITIAYGFQEDVNNVDLTHIQHAMIGDGDVYVQQAYQWQDQYNQLQKTTNLPDDMELQLKGVFIPFATSMIVYNSFETWKQFLEWRHNEYTDLPVQLNVPEAVKWINHLQDLYDNRDDKAADSDSKISPGVEPSEEKIKEAIPTVKYLVAELKNNNRLIENGIFHVNGTKKNVDAMKQQLKADQLSVDKKTPTADLTSLFKSFIDSLHVVPYHLYDDVVEAGKKIESMKDQNIDMMDNYQQVTESILIRLDKTRRELLEFIIDFMNQVAHYHNTNKMDAHNLATVFAPTFFHGDTFEDVENIKYVIEFIKTLMEIRTSLPELEEEEKYP
jgi:FtsZ-binding cell division protein ZapB